MSFSAASRDIRRARATEAKRDKAAARGKKWAPPGGGKAAFAGGGRGGKSHNVHVSRGAGPDAATWEAATKPAAAGRGKSKIAPGSAGARGREGPNLADDPWEGSEFKRQMLITLSSKLLMKTALAAFAAAAQGARDVRTNVRRVWVKNRAKLLVACLDALKENARIAAVFESKASTVATERLRKHARAGLKRWRFIAVRDAEERKRNALADAAYGRRAAGASFSQWRAARVATDIDAHVTSLARTFRDKRLAVAALHAWAMQTKAEDVYYARVSENYAFARARAFKDSFLAGRRARAWQINEMPDRAARDAAAPSSA